jgi:hypothetical protein
LRKEVQHYKGSYMNYRQEVEYHIEKEEQRRREDPKAKQYGTAKHDRLARALQKAEA